MGISEQGLRALLSERRVADTAISALHPHSVPAALHELEVGMRAVVCGPTGYDATVIRLLEMGLTPGTEVVLSRRAPSNDPIEIQVRGTRVCLRRADAARFPVKVVGSREG